jgi:hypothetical protein
MREISILLLKSDKPWSPDLKSLITHESMRCELLCISANIINLLNVRNLWNKRSKTNWNFDTPGMVVSLKVAITKTVNNCKCEIKLIYVKYCTSRKAYSLVIT